jgi:hypothetical protein
MTLTTNEKTAFEKYEAHDFLLFFGIFRAFCTSFNKNIQTAL